jgi:hypothetical protein
MARAAATKRISLPFVGTEEANKCVPASSALRF